MMKNTHALPLSHHGVRAFPLPLSRGRGQAQDASLVPGEGMLSKGKEVSKANLSNELKDFKDYSVTSNCYGIISIVVIIKNRTVMENDRLFQNLTECTCWYMSKDFEKNDFICRSVLFLRRMTINGLRRQNR